MIMTVIILMLAGNMLVNSQDTCNCYSLFAPVRLPADNPGDSNCGEWGYVPSTNTGEILSNITVNETIPDVGNETTSDLSNSTSLNITELLQNNGSTILAGLEQIANMADVQNGPGVGAIVAAVIGSVLGLVVLVIFSLLVVGFIIFKSKYKTAKYFVHNVSGKSSVSTCSLSLIFS